MSIDWTPPNYGLGFSLSESFGIPSFGGDDDGGGSKETPAQRRRRREREQMRKALRQARGGGGRGGALDYGTGIPIPTEPLAPAQPAAPPFENATPVDATPAATPAAPKNSIMTALENPIVLGVAAVAALVVVVTVARRWS